MSDVKAEGPVATNKGEQGAARATGSQSVADIFGGANRASRRTGAARQRTTRPREARRRSRAATSSAARRRCPGKDTVSRRWPEHHDDLGVAGRRNAPECAAPCLQHSPSDAQRPTCALRRAGDNNDRVRGWPYYTVPEPPDARPRRASAAPITIRRRPAPRRCRRLELALGVRGRQRQARDNGKAAVDLRATRPPTSSPSQATLSTMSCRSKGRFRPSSKRRPRCHSSGAGRCRGKWWTLLNRVLIDHIIASKSATADRLWH